MFALIVMVFETIETNRKFDCTTLNFQQEIKMGKSHNKNLHNAKKGKNDEFYTQLSDIERELKHYKHHFKDKVVYCNCDDPRVSNFFHYFSYNFDKLGLKHHTM